MRAQFPAMCFSRFPRKRLPEFNAMLDAAKGAFGAAWVSHMLLISNKASAQASTNLPKTNSTKGFSSPFSTDFIRASK
jgi:hypothetical protein